MAAEASGWEKVQKADAEEAKKTPGGVEQQLDNKKMSSDLQTIDETNEIKNSENIVGDEDYKEKKEDAGDAVNDEEDDKLKCHDTSGSRSVSDENKSNEKVYRRKHKKRALKGKLMKKTNEQKVEGAHENSSEEKLECHSGDSKSNSGDDSSKSSSKSDSGSKTDSSSKSNKSGSKSDSSNKSKSGSDSGGKKNKGKKMESEQRNNENFVEQNKVTENNKPTKSQQGIEGKGTEHNVNTEVTMGKKNGILGRIMEKLPIFGKNVIEEGSETFKEAN